MKLQQSQHSRLSAYRRISIGFQHGFELELYVSSHLLPWLLSIVPANLYCNALRASAAIWIPFSNTGNSETCFDHRRLFQMRVECIYNAMTCPKPQPFLSLLATTPLTAKLRSPAAMYSSLSHFPVMGLTAGIIGNPHMHVSKTPMVYI